MESNYKECEETAPPYTVCEDFTVARLRLRRAFQNSSIRLAHAELVPRINVWRMPHLSGSQELKLLATWYGHIVSSPCSSTRRLYKQGHDNGRLEVDQCTSSY